MTAMKMGSQFHYTTAAIVCAVACLLAIKGVWSGVAFLSLLAILLFWLGARAAKQGVKD
jgi:hypothetical protein